MCKVAKKIYYLVGVGEISLKRQALFSYESDTNLKIGQLVLVPIKKNQSLGVVLKIINKPKFRTKKISFNYEYFLSKPSIQLLTWSLAFYPNEQGATVKLFLPSNMLKKQLNMTLLKKTDVLTVKLPSMTRDQKMALQILSQRPNICLLHGKTGTGKTRVYIEAITKVLKDGQSVILLAPEISLSEQLYNSISKHFTNVIRYNSLQTIAERRKLWLALSQSKQPHLIIGPRSALFLPISNIGLIIIDEAHDTSYKQQQSPYYTTLHVAAKLAKINKVPLIYGTATPNTSDYYTAKLQNYPIIEMSERPIKTKSQLSTDFTIINIRDRQLFTKNHYISNESINYIKQSLKNGKQSLLLLNRRGTAQLLQCEDCAWQYRCSQCDHTLVYHKDIHRAICHYCDKKFMMISICPEDNGAIKLFSVGTKFIEELCHSLFPSEKVMRLDTDSINRSNVTQTVQSITKGESSILVGTQLIAKGLDLPLLNTVIILDASRQSSDYLSDERYYQLLNQVIGRGMRGHQKTRVIIQTNNPNDNIIEWAIKDNWEEFYKNEIDERKKYYYPPFCHLATLRYSRASSDSAEKIGQKIISKIISLNPKLQTLGPIPLRTVNGKGEWEIIVKSKSRQYLIEIVNILPGDFIIDIDPVST